MKRTVFLFLVGLIFPMVSVCANESCTSSNWQLYSYIADSPHRTNHGLHSYYSEDKILIQNYLQELKGRKAHPFSKLDYYDYVVEILIDHEEVHIMAFNTDEELVLYGDSLYSFSYRDFKKFASRMAKKPQIEYVSHSLDEARELRKILMNRDDVLYFDYGYKSWSKHHGVLSFSVQLPITETDSLMTFNEFMNMHSAAVYHQIHDKYHSADIMEYNYSFSKNKDSVTVEYQLFCSGEIAMDFDLFPISQSWQPYYRIYFQLVGLNKREVKRLLKKD